MIRHHLGWAVAATLTVTAAPARADEPGPGGFKSPNPITGEQVYQAVCQACHMADAKGGAGAGTMPALAANRNLAVAAYPVMMVVNGRGAMPWFRDMLNPAQIANVVNYVRTHFGNDYRDAVKPDAVAAMTGPAAGR